MSRTSIQKKTVSFKEDQGDRNPTTKSSWSSIMAGQEESSSDGEYATRVAAAAYAIAMLDEEEARSTVNQKSKEKENGSTILKRPESSKALSRWLSGKINKEEDEAETAAREEAKHPEGERWIRRTSTTSSETSSGKSGGNKLQEKASSIKKAPTFSDKYLNDTFGRESKSEPSIPPPPWKTKPKPGSGAAQLVTDTGGGELTKKKINVEYDSEADAWERDQLDKIRQRFDKLSSTILEWEEEKKTKAKRRINRKESELEERRAAALQEYRNAMSRIDQVVAGSKAIAEEKKRKDEEKTMEKANIYRSTGRIPRASTNLFSCF